MKTLALLAVLAAQCAALAHAAPATIGGVTYENVDPGDPFQERPAPKADWQPPAPTRAERAAGLLAYVAPDPGEYRPDRVPRPQEHADRLSSFLTPGEEEPVTFGVRALSDAAGLSVRFEAGTAPVTGDVRHMHFWPQRTGWRSRQWYMTPELLLPFRDGKQTVPAKRGILEERAFDVKAGETAAFWLTLAAGQNARPGVYEARVLVQAAGKPALNLPLRIEVMPFTLQRPADRSWLLYADTGRWKSMSDAQVMAELRDFARHGQTGLVEMPLGTPDLSGLKSGNVRFDAAAFRKMAAQCREAGLPGPHVCSYGGVPERVRDALGLKGDLMKGTWPDAVREGVSAVARAAVQATADAPGRWLFYGWDEPAGDNTYAVQDYQAWRAGGAPTYATFYQIGFLESASKYLTAPCFVVGLVSSEKAARAAREECARTGAEFWWYGTGSYVNPFPQEGYMFHNRYGAGYLFWKTGARAQASWAFCRPHEDVFNDFDGSQANAAEPKEQVTAYPHFLRPDDWSTYQGAIPTIAWESLREGVDDYLYLYTLSRSIAEALAHPQQRVRDAGREAQETLNALVESIPWANPMDGVAFEARRMQQVRRAVAGHITNLQAVLAGKTPAAGSRTTGRVTLVVRATAPEAAGTPPLPAIALLPAAAPPTIDGDLSDPAWTGSAVANDFRRADDAGKPEAGTEARILHDARALYVAFRCAEPAMADLVAKQQGHDTPMVWLDDGVEFFLGAGKKGPYVHLIVNTNASVYDERNQDPAWNPAAQVRVRKERDAWCTEIALPWADLERSGIRRSSALAVNFCRSRFAGREKNPHTAWSCTFGGFHVPERFGLALLQEGQVVLESVQVPALWGRQAVAVKLRNRTNGPVEARVSLDGAPLSVSLAAGASRSVEIPIVLAQSPPAGLRLTWGIAGAPAQEALLPVTVPEPALLARAGGMVSPGDTLELPTAIRIAPADQSRYRIRLAATVSGKTQTIEVPAVPGRSARLRLDAPGKFHLSTCLVDSAGRPLGATVEETVLVLPE